MSQDGGSSTRPGADTRGAQIGRCLLATACGAGLLVALGCGTGNQRETGGGGGGGTTVGRFVDPGHPDASDGNPGTADLPWRTLARAATGAAPGETVWVRAGVYTDGLDIAVSGEAGRRIVFAAYPGDQVVLRNRGIEVRGQSHVEVSGFRIEECMGGAGDQRGITVRGIEHGPAVGDIVVADNHIDHTYSSAISVWGVPWHDDPGDFRRIVGLLIERNTIERANDGGHDEQITLANGVEEFEIRHNVLRHGGSGANGGEGIDIKEGCAFGSIHHNVVHDIQRRAIYIDGGGRDPNYRAPTHHIDVHSNIAYNVVNGFAIMSEGGEDVHNIRVYNNVFYNITDDCAFVYDHPNAAANPGQFWNIEFTNNTFWDCGRTGLDLNSNQLISGIVVSNNILVSYADRNNLASEASNLVGGNPGFVNEIADDFRLTLGSPALDAGTPANAPDSDIVGVGRPQGPGIDIGAYELVR